MLGAVAVVVRRAAPLLLALFLASCAKTPDATLAEMRAKHEATLVRLKDIAYEDSRAGVIDSRVIRLAHVFPRGDHPRLTEARWTEYQRLLATAGLESVGTDGKSVSFRVDLVGEFTKGILYSEQPVEPLMESLDDFFPTQATKTTSHGDYVAYKPLKPNWYLWAHYY